MAQHDATVEEIEAAAASLQAVIDRIPGPADLGRGSAEGHLRTAVQWAKRALSDYHPVIDQQQQQLVAKDQEIADLRAQLADQGA